MWLLLLLMPAERATYSDGFLCWFSLEIYLSLKFGFSEWILCEFLNFWAWLPRGSKGLLEICKFEASSLKACFIFIAKLFQVQIISYPNNFQKSKNLIQFKHRIKLTVIYWITALHIKIMLRAPPVYSPAGRQMMRPKYTRVDIRNPIKVQLARVNSIPMHPLLFL